MGSWKAIYNDIASKPRAKKFPRAEGPRARLLPKVNFLPEVEAAISLYIARQDPIYIINIPLFLSQFAKEFVGFTYLVILL